ncbi:MAG: SAM-dependent methyltransferase [Burkholderiaceae bacterium]
MKTLPGKLVLVPAPLSQNTLQADLLPTDLIKIRQIRSWLVENTKTARHILKIYAHPGPMAELNIVEISDALDDSKLVDFLERQCLIGSVGVLSDAGCPGVADPGARAVAAAHSLNIDIDPLVGPSSVLLALMASGLNGQRFRFHGYLPVQADERRQVILATERKSVRLIETQIAIETPYRNNAFFAAVLQVLQPNTRLCVASDLTGPDQSIQSLTVDQWRQQSTTLPKIPTIFLWQGQALQGKKV